MITSPRDVPVLVARDNWSGLGAGTWCLSWCPTDRLRWNGHHKRRLLPISARAC